METSHAEKVLSPQALSRSLRTMSVGFGIALVATLLNLASPLLVVLDLIVGVKDTALATEYRLPLVGDLLWVVAVIVLMTGDSARPVDDASRLRRTWAVLGLVLSASRHLWPELVNRHVIPELNRFPVPCILYLCGVAGYVGLLALLSYLRARVKAFGNPMAGVGERLGTVILMYGIAGAISLATAAWFAFVLLPRVASSPRLLHPPVVIVRLVDTAAVGLFVSFLFLAHALFNLARGSYALANDALVDGE